jgi:hypothetical protein
LLNDLRFDRGFTDNHSNRLLVACLVFPNYPMVFKLLVSNRDNTERYKTRYWHPCLTHGCCGCLCCCWNDALPPSLSPSLSPSALAAPSTWFLHNGIVSYAQVLRVQISLTACKEEGRGQGRKRSLVSAVSCFSSVQDSPN